LRVTSSILQERPESDFLSVAQVDFAADSSSVFAGLCLKCPTFL